jgi:HEPN domain-containing protein
METDSAKVLLDKAFEELQVLDVLLGQEGVALWIFGFHAQQIAERSLKAVLILKGHDPPEKTHDLRRLSRELAASGGEFPAWASGLERLTAFAIQFRYETDQIGEGLDRRQARALVVRVYNWAASTAGAGVRGAGSSGRLSSRSG